MPTTLIDMNILMISTDRGLLIPHSSVAQRHRHYGSLVDDLHIILFSLKNVHGQNSIDLEPNVHVYPTASRSKLFYLSDAYRIGKQILCKKNITLITAQNPFETGLVAWLLSRGRIRMDVQLHTDPFSPYFLGGHNIMNRMRMFMMRFLLPRAYAVRVVSRRIQQKVKKFAPQAKITVLPIFVNVKSIESYTPSYDLHALYPQFKIIILALSRLEPEKRITLGIDALARIAPTHPEVGLVVVGKGSQQASLEKYAKNKGVADRVVFHGWVEETSSAFKTADIFILMSDFEGYAMTLIEAAAASTPILTTDVGLVGDILIDEESALVCAPRDSVCMAKQLERLIINSSLRAQLAEHAHRAVKERVIQNQQDFLSAYGAVWKD